MRFRLSTGCRRSARNSKRPDLTPQSREARLIRPADNQVRLQLFALDYNLGNFLRRLVLPPAVKHWTMTTLREQLIKIGGKVVRHAKYVRFQLAEVVDPRKLFAAILERIQRLRRAHDALVLSG